MSLANQVLDFHDDLNKEGLKKIAASANPEVMKSAVSSPTELSENDYALQIKLASGEKVNKYPIKTIADAWLADKYFEKNAGKLHKEAAEKAAWFIKKACAKHGLKPSRAVETLAKEASTNVYTVGMSKVAYAQVETEESTGTHYALRGQYPLFSEEFVKKACDYFATYRDYFSPEDRSEFASNVLARAEELGVIPENKKDLEKVAGADYGDGLGYQLRKREEILHFKPELKEELSKLASEKDTLPAKEFAAKLHSFDKKAGVQKYYGSYVADAFESTFKNSIEKKASGYSWEDENLGISVTERELTDAAENKFDKIKGYFGESVANALKKHASPIFDSLPNDAKIVIAKISKGML